MARSMPDSLLDSLLDSTVLDANGDRIGKVKQIYLDNESGCPTWVSVSTGLFSSDSLVPLAGARRRDDKDPLRVQVSKDRVKSAPHLDSEGRISRDAEIALFSHYGIAAQPVSWNALGGRQSHPGSDVSMPWGGADPAASGETGAAFGDDASASPAGR